jgi:hypothetical protein
MHRRNPAHSQPVSTGAVSGRPQEVPGRTGAGKMNIQTLIIAMSIPSAVTGFCFWLLEKSITKKEKTKDEAREKRQKELDEKEKLRDKLLYILIESVNASIALSEATAKAVQRIPDAHCNGDMDAALQYATKVKKEQKDFLTQQGIKNVLEL